MESLFKDTSITGYLVHIGECLVWILSVKHTKASDHIGGARDLSRWAHLKLKEILNLEQFNEHIASLDNVPVHPVEQRMCEKLGIRFTTEAAWKTNKISEPFGDWFIYGLLAVKC